MPRRLALIIANNEFADARLSSLVSPKYDADELSAVLSDQEIGNFEVKTLVNSDMLTIRREIASFYQRKQQDDLLLLYYSGHGIKDSYGDLFFATKDTDIDLAAATSLDSSYVRDQLDKSISRRKIIILDCCYSGAFDKSAKNLLNSSAGTEEVFAGSGYGRVIMTATNSVQYAWDGKNILGKAETSLFTHFLIEGLKTGEADINQDGKITADELYDYTYDRSLSEASVKTTPQKWEHKVEGNIVIASSKQNQAEKTSLPTWITDSLLSTNSSVRLAAVAELGTFSRGVDAEIAALANQKLKEVVEQDVDFTVRGAAAGALGPSSEEYQLNSLRANRRKSWMLLGLLILVTIIGLAVGLISSKLKPSSPNINPTLTQQTITPTPSPTATIDSAVELPELQRFGRGTVTYLSVDPAENYLAVAGSLGVWLFDFKTMEPIKLLAHSDPVYSVTWSPDGKELAALERGGIKIWNLDSYTGDQSQIVTYSGWYDYVVWSQDKKYLAIGINGDLYIWDTTEQKVVEVIDNLGDGCASWSPDGQHLVIGSNSNISIIKVGDWKNTEVLASEYRVGEELVWSPDSTKLFTGYDWINIENGDVTRESNYEVKYAPDQSLYLTGDYAAVTIYNSSTKSSVQKFSFTNDLNKLVLTSSGQLISFNEEEGTIYKFDAGTGRQAGAIRGFLNHMDSVAWSPSGLQLASGSYKTIKLWTLGNPDPTGTIDLETYGSITDLEWSPDGKYLAASVEKNIFLLEPQSSKVVDEFTVSSDKSISNIAWSPENNLLAAAYEDFAVWNVASKESVFQFSYDDKNVSSLSWSPNGKSLAVTFGEGIAVWDTTTWKQVSTFKGSAYWWDITKGAMKTTEEVGFYPPIQSPDGKYVTGKNCTLRIMETSTPSIVGVVTSANGCITDVAWAPDSKRIATAGDDGTVRIFEVVNTP